MERETLTVEEAARALGIGRQSAYNAARDGSLPVIHVGRRLVVPRVALQRLLATGEWRPTGPAPWTTSPSAKRTEPRAAKTQP